LGDAAQVTPDAETNFIDLKVKKVRWCVGWVYTKMKKLKSKYWCSWCYLEH
jgi:hypothetical protein